MERKKARLHWLLITCLTLTLFVGCARPSTPPVIVTAGAPGAAAGQSVVASTLPATAAQPLAVQLGGTVPAYSGTPTPDLPHNAADTAATLPGSNLKLIPDSELVYGPAAQDFDVSAFVTPLGGHLLTVAEEVEGQQLSGPEIVQLVADRYSLNPRLLLAVLEHQSGWVTQRDGVGTLFPLGNMDSERSGLWLQLNWAANLLNLGYYGRSEGGLMGMILADGTAVPFAPQINHGTASVQQFFAAPTNTGYVTWQAAVGPGGFIATYERLFGNPFGYAVEPLLPADLTQPPLALPWSGGETWYLTGGPHAGWNTGSAWAALDFVPPGDQVGCYISDDWVTAVAEGVVTRSGFGAVVVDLDGDGFAGTGWAITYMHLATQDRAPVGTQVVAGDRIGHPSCEGGVSNGTHLHLARTYNGRWISADGALPFDLAGWVSSGAGTEYDGWLSRGGEAREACVCREPINGITAD